MADSSKNPILSPAEVKGFPIDNPKAKIVKDRGQVRVVERHYYWDKVKGRGLEKRTYIGYVVDGVYYSNEQYRAKFMRTGKKRVVPRELEVAPSTVVSALESKQAAEFPLYYAVARDTGLLEDLTAVWGAHCAQIMLSVAFHWIHTGHNAAYLYESWSPGKLLPYAENLSSKELSGFFENLVQKPGWRKDFFQARVNRLPENEVLSFDATAIASEAEDMSYVRFGKGKEGGYQSQIGLIVLLGHRTQMPVLFRLLPGNITDVTTVPDMLFRFDEITDKKRVFAAVMDRGYCSIDNIARFIDQDCRVILAAKTNLNWIVEAMEDAMTDMWRPAMRIQEKKCWGRTVEMQKVFPDGKTRTFWVHVYRSESKSHVENDAFFADLENFEKAWANFKPSAGRDATENALLKSPLLKFYKNPGLPGRAPLVRDEWALESETRYFGFFCNITTFECTAEEAIVEYSTRDCIEKSFKAGKSYADLDTLRAHGDETAEGRLLIGFCCMTILSRIYQLMGETVQIDGAKGRGAELPPLINEMTFNELRNHLSSIRLVFDGKGNKRWCEVTKKQHRIAARLGYPDLYTALPDWCES